MSDRDQPDTKWMVWAVVGAGVVLLLFLVAPTIAFLAVPFGVLLLVISLAVFSGTGLRAFAAGIRKRPKWTLGQLGLTAVLASLCPEYWGSVWTYLGGLAIIFPIVWLATLPLRQN